MANIYDTANQLERDLRETEQYMTLVSAFESMKADESSYQVFKEFQNAQLEIQNLMGQGQAPDETKMQEWQTIAKKLDDYPLVKTLMEHEQAMDLLMRDINGIVTKPMADLYKN
ncbi:YlbF family regulator [Periweissella beninensis]|uniref:UPF0342 protein KAK10_06560 n=1 Tax=Periweissella beninensis TaxID=504936 RepID=A0ABT0VIA7_9LACO|nr:YlbF family regulator [Periweissella beninensis]MBM7544225.1 cell fate (sporulation/competence/biofilm development) regulator YlbF (YheA/YmcA/DUF963 family) [Periweissella beninensis]MCM2437568.1 YlbF family regulator [Periweissella beninensis]MCT4396603.1 hypothetical protein [Periweissella beninensis]